MKKTGVYLQRGSPYLGVLLSEHKRIGFATTYSGAARIANKLSPKGWHPVIGVVDGKFQAHFEADSLSLLPTKGSSGALAIVNESAPVSKEAWDSLDKPHACRACDGTGWVRLREHSDGTATVSRCSACPDKPSLRTAFVSLQMHAMHARKRGDHETSQRLEDVAEYLKDVARGR